MLSEKYEKYIIYDQPLPEADKDISPQVLESWKRSKNFQLPWQKLKEYHLSSQVLQDTLSKNQFLLETGHSYMTTLYQYLKNTGILLSLTDAQGTIIDFIGDNITLSDITEHTNLYLGAMRDEKHAGTTGIGLCLVTQSPTQIQGAEHYCQTFHHYIGTAAPIRDRNGQIIGVLGSVAPIEQTNQNYILAMICSAADSISKELSMEQSLNHVRKVKNQLSATIEAIPSGILFTDTLGVILQHNRIASQLLESYQNLKGEKIDQLIFPKASGQKITDLTQNIHNVEYNIIGYSKRKKSISISTSFVYDLHHKAIGKIILLDETNKLHQLAGKLSGLHATYTFDSIIGSSPELSAAITLARTAADSSSNVLILGESGTGKELFAQAIHNASNRADFPFVAINCGSLPKELIESELFGYVPGAFTGASKNGQPGKFELANGGTIFLDEIGDMPLALQVSLLRVLQTKTITRLGDTHERKIDVRVITATNVNLMEAVHNQTFRSDLYYRLNVLSIEVPPLCERKTDIPDLIHHFIAEKSRNLEKNVTKVSPPAIEALCSYTWPGNIRELENIIERAVNLADQDFITPEHLPRQIFEDLSNTSSNNCKDSNEKPESSVLTYPAQSNLDLFLQELIQVLHDEKGNISQAAKHFNISKRTLYRKINKYQINLKDFRF